MLPRYFLLSISINEYESRSIPNLKGCLNDAEAIKTSLERIFGPSPEAAILFLANAGATRAAILSAFHAHLIDNPKIERGDRIVIFFAGHGSRVRAPIGWAAPSGLVRIICPSDLLMPDSEGRPIHGIPDVTINALLRILAREKGNNITFVCDSCASESVSGGQARPWAAASMPVDVDYDILQNTNSEGRGFRLHGSHSSHVLLTATAVGESAIEDDVTGVFVAYSQPH
ncbi:hypothetical protein B0H10DRAFT_1910167 [Mycena sp. CBHHK59/15]|nr:hypothetical protein B0H10DRAFT_1910167 [Mycena sp. CBHHK59/15]